MVLGKEIVITNVAMQAMFERFFGEGLLIQDLWFDQNSKQVHLKIGKIVNSQNRNLEEHGFAPVTDPAKYPVREKLDSKVAQLLQSSAISHKDW